MGSDFDRAAAALIPIAMVAVGWALKAHRNWTLRDKLARLGYGVGDLQYVPMNIELGSSPILHIASEFHEILGFERFKRRGWVRISMETLRKTFLGSLEKHQKNTVFCEFYFSGVHSSLETNSR